MSATSQNSAQATLLDRQYTYSPGGNLDTLDTVISRYLRTDPLGIDGGLNLYVYAMNSPLMFTDPDGLIARATWDNRHDVLAGAGLIPGLGIIPDAMDTVLYAAEGDMGNAALSGLAMVPILGQGSRGAQYAAKYGDEALDAAKYVYKNADEAIAAGRVTPQLTTTVITDTNRMLPAPTSGQKLLPVPNKVDYSVIPDPKNVGPGKNFTLKQKQEALTMNRQANQGVVRSDTSGVQLVQPQKSQKGITPDPLEWQFDHKIPKNKGGTNSSSNLQIISRQNNRSKWDN